MIENTVDPVLHTLKKDAENELSWFTNPEKKQLCS